MLTIFGSVNRMLICLQFKKGGKELMFKLKIVMGYRIVFGFWKCHSKIISTIITHLTQIKKKFYITQLLFINHHDHDIKKILNLDGMKALLMLLGKGDGCSLKTSQIYILKSENYFLFPELVWLFWKFSVSK